MPLLRGVLGFSVFCRCPSLFLPFLGKISGYDHTFRTASFSSVRGNVVTTMFMKFIKYMECRSAGLFILKYFKYMSQFKDKFLGEGKMPNGV